jgi:hypothetical protein
MLSRNNLLPHESLPTFQRESASESQENQSPEVYRDTLHALPLRKNTHIKTPTSSKFSCNLRFSFFDEPPFSEGNYF